MIAPAVPDLDPADRPALPSDWNGAERARLRRDAEAGKIELELKPCQRVTGQILKF